MATYDYPYFNLRLTSLEVEAETPRRAKTRAVGGLYSWRASGAPGGWCGFSLHQRVPPTHHPRWYSNIAYDNTPSALKAVLDEFDPSRSASLALGKNHILENSQKLPPRVFQPLGASTLAHGWVRTVRTAQNLQKRRHSVGRTRRRGRLRAAQMVHSGPIEPRLWPGSIYKDRMRWPTHVNGLAAAIR